MRTKATLLGLLFVVASGWLCWPAERGTAERRARPGDLAMHIELIPRDGVITAGEPLIAELTFVNQAEETIEVWLRSGRKSIYLEVYKGKGQLVAATPKPEIDTVGGVFDIWELSPGKSVSKTWVVSGWYQFEEPGQYALRVQLQDEGGVPVMCEGSASVRVLPFDAARLEARCEELFQPLRKGARYYGDIDSSERARALRSVRHDIVLPYLDWMARGWHDEYSCLALRRIGTERAQALTAALVARQDKVGEAARRALEMPLEPTLYEVSR